jgi:hypothetical protein
MIKLIKAFPYDNSYDYVKMFATKQEQNNYFNSLPSIRVDDTNYIKMHKTINVKYSFDYLENEGINYIIFNNGYKDIYAFIVNKRYVREELTELIYEVDVIQTYMFDFSVGNSFVERKVCNINEITDFDEGLEIGEHTIVQRNVLLEKTSTWFAMFNGFREQQIIYDDNGKIKDVIPFNSALQKPSTLIDGIQYPLFFMPLPNGQLHASLADHPSLVGIVRFPNCTYSTQEVKIPLVIKVTDIIGGSDEVTYKNISLVVDMATVINSSPVTSGSVSIPKNEITDYFPYTYYVLTDGESEPIIMKPQYMPSSLAVKGEFALSHTPVERYYPIGYKGDNTGKIYNITNTNQMMLPTGTNEGANFLSANANSVMQGRKSQITNSVISGVAGLAGVAGSIATGNVLGAFGSAVGAGLGVASGLNNILQIDARNKDIEMTPNSISSFGTPSTRYAFDTNNVELIKYSITDKVKIKIQNFVNRYGNKYNNYAVINLRSYKGYIKFVEPNIDSKIDNIYINKIKEILERGVYIE